MPLGNEEAQALPKECCGACKFYRANGTKISEGLCHRFPPHPNLIIGPPAHPNMPPQMIIKADLPPVAIKHWCGEYVVKALISPASST